MRAFQLLVVLVLVGAAFASVGHTALAQAPQPPAQAAIPLPLAALGRASWRVLD